MDVHVYQIVYSAETRKARDPGFEELDNLSNERPDWYEYWPIRRYLKERTLDEGSYYGFVSPKFGEKTGLKAEAVHEFILAHPEREVILFSPAFDHMAFYRSVFEQGEAHHPGLTRLTMECLARAGVDSRLPAFTCSKNSVFSNYFVARPSFWKKWFEITEAVFRIAEQPGDPLAARLNAGAQHDGSSSPYKVFVIERIAPYLLSRYPLSAIKAFPLIQESHHPVLHKFPVELVILDSLKFCYIESGNPAYMEIFEHLRRQIDQAFAQGSP
jgi:hypothetical protein